MSSVKKIIIFSLISAALFLLVIIFLVVPFCSSIKEISNQIVEDKKNLASFKNEVQKAEQFEESYQNLEINPEKINEFLVNPSIPIELIKFIESLGKSENLYIKISPASVLKTDKDYWNSIGFSIELVGDFPSTMKFLEKLESSHYFIKTQKLHTRTLSEKDASFGKYASFPVGEILTDLEIKVFTKD